MMLTPPPPTHTHTTHPNKNLEASNFLELRLRNPSPCQDGRLTRRLVAKGTFPQMRLQSAAWSLKGTAQCGLDAACDRTTTPGTGNDKPSFKHTHTIALQYSYCTCVYICHSFYDSTSLCKQQEDGYCCPCSTLQHSYCTSISVTASTTVPAFASNKMFIGG